MVEENLDEFEAAIARITGKTPPIESLKSIRNIPTEELASKLFPDVQLNMVLTHTASGSDSHHFYGHGDNRNDPSRQNVQ